MIGLLYKRYKRQIILAIFLVVAENITFIAEPYVFGVAIDDFREANRVEDVVDSSETDFLLHSIVDSLREHLLDSLMREERKPQNDTSIGSNERAEVRYIPALFTPPIQSRITRRHSVRRDSLRRTFDSAYKRYLEGRGSDTLVGSVHEPIKEEARRVARRHELIKRSLTHSKEKHKRAGFNRDSARNAVKHASDHRENIVQAARSDRSFSFPRDVGPFLPPLLPWVLLFVTSSVIGGVRRRYDTRVYSVMFAELSGSIVDSQLKRGVDISKVAGRSDIAYSNIEFFQYNLPEFIEQIISVGGAVLALSLFDWRLATIGAGLLGVVALASRLYMARVERVQEEINNLKEKEYDTFMTAEPALIKDYYKQHSHYEIVLSKLGATSHWILRAVMLGMFLGTLYISIDLDRFTIGQLYSIVAYVWTFVTASEYIPYLSEKWINLRDASRRINEVS